MRFYDSLNFEKNKKICMEKVAGEQDLALSISDILQVIADNIKKF